MAGRLHCAPVWMEGRSGVLSWELAGCVGCSRKMTVAALGGWGDERRRGETTEQTRATGSGWFGGEESKKQRTPGWHSGF